MEDHEKIVVTTFGILTAAALVHLYRRQNKTLILLRRSIDVTQAWMEADYQKEIEEEFSKIVDRYENE